jgi:hypothetical protein
MCLPYTIVNAPRSWYPVDMNQAAQDKRDLLAKRLPAMAGAAIDCVPANRWVFPHDRELQHSLVTAMHHFHPELEIQMVTAFLAINGVHQPFSETLTLTRLGENQLVGPGLLYSEQDACRVMRQKCIDEAIRDEWLEGEHTASFEVKYIVTNGAPLMGKSNPLLVARMIDAMRATLEMEDMSAHTAAAGVAPRKPARRI